MADSITRQVSEQVKRAMEVAGLTKPLPPLKYPLIQEGETSHQPEGMSSLRPMEHSREIGAIGFLPGGKWACGCGARRLIRTRDNAVSVTASTPYATHSRQAAWLEEQEQTSQRLRFLRQEQEPAPPPPRDKEYFTEVVATIAGGYVEEITRSYASVTRLSSKALRLTFWWLMYPQPVTTMKRMEHSFINSETKHNSLQPMLKQKSKTNINKTGGRGLHVGFSIVLGRSPPQRPAYARPQSTGKPQNTGRPHMRLQGLARPYRGIRRCRSGLAGSHAPWLGPHQPQPSPADAVALSSRSRRPLGPPAASHSVSVSGDEPL
ncbi:hypothetical protein Cgig2_025424 [Carnegiea gigantea]|uniref:Uncharacterized protein n=1 Tax=Carnegiea gigantea TaxID=171969 RepID=A0A9Q1K0V1_9CARY|nr:hypothetical protein Cgig2_025424 [Carnegiea gigantea]